MSSPNDDNQSAAIYLRVLRIQRDTEVFFLKPSEGGLSSIGAAEAL
jgi:hypothetical protein